MIFVGDKGVRLELEFRDYEDVNGTPTDVAALDISAAIDITFLTKKPDGAAGTAKTMSSGLVVLTSGGVDGKAYYETEAGFLDLAGAWQLQGLVELSGGAKHYSEIVSFKVMEHL